MSRKTFSKVMRQVTKILLLLALMHGVNCLCAENAGKENPPCKDIRVIHTPSEPSQEFASFEEDENTPATSFVARGSRLKEVYIWVHEPLSGSVGAQVLHGGFSGPVIATGIVSGKDKGKQEVLFSNDIYLEKGETYCLKLFKGEPATVQGSVARAAENSDEIQGYNSSGPVAYDLAHELLFDEWEGVPALKKILEGKKKLVEGYEQKVNAALDAATDVWGEQVLALPEGPTFENIKDYLTPLKILGTAYTESGIYYIPFGRPVNLAGFGPAALHVGDGSQIISQELSGDKVTVFTGASGNERYGYFEASLEQERLEGGYYPVLQNQYTDVDGVTYFQESFSDYLFATTELVSFVKLKVSKGASGIDSVKVAFLFSDKEKLVLEDNTIKSGNKTRAFVSPGGILSEGNRLVYDLDISKGDRELYLARLLHPARCDHKMTITADLYQAEKRELKDYWDGELAKGATFDVPEERVNNACKNLLIQNFFHGYLYSIGNAYQNWYQPECNDAAQVLGEFGFLKRQRAIHEVLFSRPPKPYRTWEMGELLSHFAQYFYISRDTTFIRDYQPEILEYLRQFEQHMIDSDKGVLAAQIYDGDIPNKGLYLHHQAVAWRGMRDMAFILKSLGDTGNGDRYLSLAQQLQARLTNEIHNCKTLLPDGSLFIPTELFTEEKPEPYENITETRYGSYWNLVFPYAAASGLLDREMLSGYYRYLKNHGAFLLGMVRFNYYPLPTGSYKIDGLPGYKTPGLDNVYGPCLSRVMAIMDDPDRMVLSFYAKLAHGMTRDTFISGEGDTVGPFPDEYYRTFYLGPANANNGWFLMMLRLMLIAETEGENGTPEKLQLAFSTPRGWLEQGKQIRVSKAPTFFGEIDYRISSDIDNGNVHVTLSMPKQADSASQILLRLRTPGNKTIKKVTINGKGYKAFDVKSETIDLTGKTGLIRLSVRY
jgi:hypothetical protein